MSDISLSDKAPKRRLTPDELDFINYCEQRWNLASKFPAMETLRKRFPSLSIDESLDDEFIILALSNRGIKVPSVDSRTDELSSEQVAAVALILDYGDKRSHNTKLRSLGISPVKWQGWLKNDVFKNYLHSLSAKGLDDALHVAHTGLLNATERGDVNAIKYYMELTGRFSGESGQVQNFKVMVQRIIETIQRHVKDPDTIRLIASDFDVILKGGVPDTNPILIKEIV
jgi:hypothetical protein